jgi:hypothetical protein
MPDISTSVAEVVVVAPLASATVAVGPVSLASLP